MPKQRAVSQIPDKTERREAMGRLIVAIGQALTEAPFRKSPPLKLIGNGATSRDGSYGSLVQIEKVNEALSAGCLAEQIYCDEQGKKRSDIETERISGM